MRIIAIIPARGGSKGVPDKNIRIVGGKPLIAWSIASALAEPGVDAVVVSTDSDAIADVARAAGAEVPFVRPAALARDETPTEPVLIHAVDALAAQGRSFDAVMLLQPTSPVRSAGLLARCIATMQEERADSLLTVTENHHFFWRDNGSVEALYDYARRPRRQDLTGDQRWLRETGSVYLTRTALLLSSGNRLGGRIALCRTSEAESWEIDSLADFAIVETFLKAELDHENQ